MGFPSPADDYVQTRLDIREHLVRRETATFFLRADSNAMLRAGIAQGDLLIVDRSLTPAHDNIVVAVVDGEFVVRRLACGGDKHSLVSADSRIKPIPIDDLDCMVWGVVTFSVRQHA